MNTMKIWLSVSVFWFCGHSLSDDVTEGSLEATQSPTVLYVPSLVRATEAEEIAFMNDCLEAVRLKNEIS